MTAIRWRIPRSPLRTSVLLAGAIGLSVVTGVAVVARAWLQLGAVYPRRAAFLFAVMMAIAIGFVGEHHPFPRFGPANHVTMIRGILVVLIASLIGEPEIPSLAAAAVVAAVVLMVLDGVDGTLARQSRMASDFGARFDVETDALLLMVLSVLVWQHGKAGAWVLLGGTMRYAFVAVGWLLPWMAQPLPSTHRGKTIAVCHMVGLTVALAPFVPLPLSALAAVSTLAALSWSFAVDVRRLWRGTN